LELHPFLGQKLKKTVVNSPNVSTVNYQGVFHYENGILRFFATAEGYVNILAGRYSYVYNYTDHLGNIRLSYMNDRLLGLLTMDETHYYPFGLKQKGYEPPPAYATSYKYKYNGKEFQDELNLNVYDYGARFYMPDIVRWGQIDPLAEKYYNINPYAYVANSPLLFIDPDGKQIIISQGTLTNAQFTQFKQETLTAMQKLTNDKLAWKGNTLIITKLGGENSNKNLTYGTNLIREQNNKQAGHKATTIEHTTGGNKAIGASNDVNKTASGTNGLGDNATVEWNPNGTTGGTDTSGSRNRPTEIGLGHELIHANHMNKGERDGSSSGKLDGDGSGIILSNEEYDTRVDENKIRKEQGLTPRQL
jgi:RHS repeat-associated protein